MVSHPLAEFVGEVATPCKKLEDVSYPEYDPSTQMQINWNDIENHLEILCSGDRTGDPDTRSATTEDFTRSDDDTDDSGT